MKYDKVVVRRSKAAKWELALRAYDSDGTPIFFDKNFDEITEQTIEVGRKDLTVGQAYFYNRKKVYALSRNLIAWAEGQECYWENLSIEEIASLVEAE